MANFTKTSSYQMLNSSSGISDMIKKTIKSYVEVDIEKISSQMIDMEATPLNRYSMKLLQGNSRANQVKMMTAAGEKVVTIALPFATYRSNGKIITNAYVDNIGRVSGDRLSCPSNVLYALLGSCTIANSVFDSYGELTNKDIMIPLMGIYSDMVLGVYNVAVHARADKKLSDIITYGARRFFLERMLNIEDESVSNIATKGLNNIDQGEYEAAASSYDAANVNNLEDWIKWSTGISPKTKGMTKKSFLEKWLRQYGEYSYFGMDNVEYLVCAILLTLASVPGFSRQLYTLIKNSKSITKFHSAIYSFGE